MPAECETYENSMHIKYFGFTACNCWSVAGPDLYKLVLTIQDMLWFTVAKKIGRNWLLGHHLINCCWFEKILQRKVFENCVQKKNRRRTGISSIPCCFLEHLVIFSIIKGHYCTIFWQKIRSTPHYFPSPAFDKVSQTQICTYIKWRDTKARKAGTHFVTIISAWNTSTSTFYFSHFLLEDFSQTNGNRLVGAPSAHYRQKQTSNGPNSTLRKPNNQPHFSIMFVYNQIPENDQIPESKEAVQVRCFLSLFFWSLRWLLGNCFFTTDRQVNLLSYTLNLFGSLSVRELVHNSVLYFMLWESDQKMYFMLRESEKVLSPLPIPSRFSRLQYFSSFPYNNCFLSSFSFFCCLSVIVQQFSDLSSVFFCDYCPLASRARLLCSAFHFSCFLAATDGLRTVVYECTLFDHDRILLYIFPCVALWFSPSVIQIGWGWGAPGCHISQRRENWAWVVKHSSAVQLEQPVAKGHGAL